MIPLMAALKFLLKLRPDHLLLMVVVLFIFPKRSWKLPWQSLGIDVVVESTGSSHHLKKPLFIKAGAKRVVISAPFEGHHENGDGKKIQF